MKWGRNKNNRRRESRGSRTEGGVVRPATIMGRVGRALTLLVVVGVMAGGLPYVGYHGYRQVLDSGYFSPKDVRVSGHTTLSAEAIIEAAGLLDAGVNLIELSRAEVEERVRALPWIKSVRVETKLPDRVEIRVVERQRLGLVNEDRLYVVDTEGNIVKAWEMDDALDGAIVSGLGVASGAPQAKARAIEAFALASLYREMGLDRWGVLDEIHFDPLLGYSLFAGEGEFRLGHGRLSERLARLWQVQSLLETREMRADYVLLDLDEDIDRIAVKLVPQVRSFEREGDASPATMAGSAGDERPAHGGEVAQLGR